MEVEVEKAFQEEREADCENILTLALAGCSRSIRRAGVAKTGKGLRRGSRREANDVGFEGRAL